MFDIFTLRDWWSKHVTRKDLVFLGILSAVFFVSRLINLEKFPIFSDEGIYIHWAKTAWHDGAMRFISLTDGKQPLQTWGTIPFLKLFPDNLLFAARLYAVVNGFFCLLGIGVLLRYVFNRKAALYGIILYIFTPYFLFYDRLALVDSGVNAAIIWILLFSIWLANTRRLDIALIFGFMGGFGLLAKSSVKIFLGLAVLAPILFIEKNKKQYINKTINYLFLFAITVIISLLLYNIQRLSPYMHLVAEKNKTFVMTFSDFFHTPFLYFFRNLKLIPWYVFQESAFILPLLGIVGLFFLFKKNKPLTIYFLLWIVIPFFVVCFLSIVLYPRYIIFIPTLLLIPAAYFLSIQKSKNLLLLLIGIYFISVLYFDYTVIFNPKSIPLVPIDRSQYLEDWPAGWGIKEIIDYSRNKSAEKPVILLAEGNFGMASDSLDSLLKRSDEGKISIWGRWPLNENDIVDAQNELSSKNVYIVLTQHKEIPSNWHVKLIQKYEKPGNMSSVYFLELLP